MYPRHLQPLIREALQDTPVVLLNGARQTGKSTLAKQVSSVEEYRYLTFDDPVVLAAVKRDPAGFIDGLSGSVILDEIQRAPEVFLAIKASVDRDRRAGRFLLTGSANILLLPNVADSLAGRMEILSLWPLSCAELQDSASFNLVDWLVDGEINALSVQPCERHQLTAKLAGGGFPEAVQRTSDKRRNVWFDSYLQAILQRDVMDLARIEQLTELPNLLQLLAARSGGLLNFADLSRTSGLSQTTLKRYFTLLEALFLVYRLPAWEKNRGKRLVKAPKLYLPDTGLLGNLCGLNRETLDAAHGLPGYMVETFVMSELVKHLAFSRRQLTLWHYRTQSDIEVDFVIEDRLENLVGIEVKASATVEGKDFRGLNHLRETEPERYKRGIVLYSGREVVPFGKNMYAIPLSMWWGMPT